MQRLTLAHPPFMAGLVWIKSGWSLFKRGAIAWSGMTALVFLVLMGVAAIPAVGGLAVYVLSPFIVAGFFAAARGGEAGDPVTFVYLGAGFREARRGLAMIGVFYLVSSLLVFKLVNSFTGGNFEAILRQAQSPDALDPAVAEQVLQGALPALTLGLILFTPLLMATWFSPGLVLFERFAPGKALWWSLWACFVNWRPLLIFSSVLGLVGVVAVLIPYGLGLLVFIPWTLASTYVGYRDSFIPIESLDPHETLAVGAPADPADPDDSGAGV